MLESIESKATRPPPAFGLGTQTCITSRRQFQINKSWVYQGDQAHPSTAASKKKKFPENCGRVCLVSSEAVHHGKHQVSKLPSHLGSQPYLKKAKHISVWATGCHLLLFSSSVMSDSLRPHGLQHPRLHCPSSSPRWSISQSHVHWVSDAIQSSHSLSSPSPALNLAQHQGLFQWVDSSHEVAKVLEFQLQHQSFQWLFRTDFH